MTHPARWLAALAALTLGCEAEDDKTAGTDVGNPVVMALRAAPAGEAVVDGADAPYGIAAAAGQVHGVVLAVSGDVACADLGPLEGGITCEDEPTRLVFQGSLTVDLVAGTLAPEARVPDFDYTGAEVLSGASDAAMGLVIELVPQQGERRVRVELTAGRSLAFQPDPGREGASFLSDPSTWLQAVDLAACAGDQPGAGPLRVVVDPADGRCEPARGR